MAASTLGKKPFKEPPTAATLFTSTGKITCCYCQEEHPSNSSGVVVQPQARKQVLQHSGRRFVCLRRGHISRDCSSRKKCSKCSGRHHISICMKGNNPTAPQGGPDRSNSSDVHTRPTPSDSPAVPRSGLNAEAPAFQAPDHRSTSLCVNSHRSILLQTAQTQAFNPLLPHLSQEVRIILDSGS